MLSCPTCTANNTSASLHCCACNSELSWELLVSLRMPPSQPKELRVTLSSSSTIADLKECIKQQHPEATRQIVVLNGSPVKSEETFRGLKLSHGSRIVVAVPTPVAQVSSPQTEPFVWEKPRKRSEGRTKGNKSFPVESVFVDSAPILEYLKRVVVPQLMDVWHRVESNSVLRVSASNRTLVDEAVKQLKQTASNVLAISVSVPHTLVMLLRATEEFQNLETKQVICYCEEGELNSSGSASVFSDVLKQKEQRTLFICATDITLIEDVKKRMESLKSTLVTKNISLQEEQLVCFQRARRAAEDFLVLADVPVAMSRGAVASTLTKMLKVPISESMLHFNNRKRTVTISQLAPAAREFLISKKVVLVNEKALQVQQPNVSQDVMPINCEALEKEHRTCLVVNRDDLTLSIHGYDPQSVEAMQTALARLIPTAMSALEVAVELAPPQELILFVKKMQHPIPSDHPLNITSILNKIVLAQNKSVQVVCETPTSAAGQEAKTTWKLKGTELATKEAVAEANAQLTALSQEMGEKLVGIDARKIQGLMNSESRIRKVMERTSTHIELEGDDRKVLLFQTANGHKLQIVRGNITCATTDAIVNASNQRLSSEAGVSLALSLVAGSVMRESCAQSIAKEGPVAVGTSRATVPGNLGCKMLIHAVGPTWEGGTADECRTLVKAVTSALDLAEKNNCSSITLPAISCGNFRFPEKKGAEMILGAIRMWCASSNTNLKAIDIAILDEKTYTAFTTTALHMADAASDLKQNDEDEALLEQMCNPPPEWYWRAMPGEPAFAGVSPANPWVSYDSNQTLALEKEYQAAVASGNHLSFDLPNAQGKKHEFSYTVHFDLAKGQHEQKNTKTHRKRPMKRARVDTVPLPSPSGTSTKLAPLMGRQFKIVGLKKNLEEAEKLLRAASDTVLAERKLTLKMQIPPDTRQGVQTIAIEHDFRATFDAKETHTIVTVQGFADNMDAVFTKIQQHLLESHLQWPKLWEPQSENLLLADVNPASAEFKEIQQRMTTGASGVPNVCVERIQRVQNMDLWHLYSLQREILRKKLAKSQEYQELSLFHGTRSTDPRLIFNGEIGFATQFCQSGMWGQGTYFAANFSYSNAYCSTKEGKSQVILADVLVGASHDCLPNAALKMPPAKGTGSGLFEVERFDSVTGVTGGSRVYVLYENCRAYPSYLITYSQPTKQ